MKQGVQRPANLVPQVNQKEASEYVNKWLRPENAPVDADYQHTFNDHNRADDFKKIRNDFVDEDSGDLTFDDFLEDAKNLADSWNDTNENDPEDFKQKKGQAFARKYASFLVPITLLFVLIILLIICIAGVCCCGVAMCCFNGIQIFKDDSTPIRQVQEM